MDDDTRRYNMIKKYKFTSILDFGCGNGGFLSLLNNEIKKYGIELNRDMINYLNMENILTTNDINTIKENIDIITMFHVLEHVYDPIKILNDIKLKMHKDSILIIEVPHANDMLIKYFNNNDFKKYTFWSEHLILHTKKSLEKLLICVGFTNINIVYEQRYNFFNHIHWLSKGKPGGHKLVYNNNNTNILNEYNQFIVN